MRTLDSSWMALADGMAGPHAGGLAMRPIVAPARHSLRKAAEQAGANARQLTYMLLERTYDDLTDSPGESLATAWAARAVTRSCSGPVVSGPSGA